MAILKTHGDTMEKQLWPELRDRFPLYEMFWQQHVFKLREHEHGVIRADVHAQLELMAQAHYKCLVSLSIALDNKDNPPERVFSSLQNASKRARTVIDHFNWVYNYCTGNAGNAMDPAAIIAFGTGMAPYRNLVHEDLIGLRVDEATGKALLPMSDKLGKYTRWSSLRTADPVDFMEVDQYIADAFEELCSLINAAWQGMLDVSKAILDSPRYVDLLPARAVAVPTAGDIVLTSNTQGVRSNVERVIVQKL